MAENKTAVPPRMAALGKQLVTGSGEELTNIAKSVGTNVPVSPVDALAIGGNLDQAKMVGGAPQIRNAIKLNLGETDVAEQKRRDTVTARGDTSAEARLQGTALGQLASLHGRVGGAVAAQIAANQGDITLVPNQSTLQGAFTAANVVDPAKQAEITGKITSLQTETDPSKRISLVAEIQRALPGIQLNTLFNMDTAAWAKKLADMTPDDLQVKYIPTELLDKTKIAAELGMPLEDLDKLSYGELKTKAVSKSKETFADVDALQALANNATAPIASRRMAAQRLREMNLTGLLQGSVEASALADVVNSQETVVVDGQQMSYAQALSDATISKVLTDPFVLDDPNKLNGTPFEGLKGIIETHKAELKGLSEQMGTASGAVEQRIQDVRGAGTIEGIPVGNTLLQMLNPSLFDEEVKAGIKLPEAPSALYGTLKTLASNPNTKVMAQGLVNSLELLQPDVLQWVKGATPEQVTTWLEAASRPGISPENRPAVFADLVKKGFGLWTELQKEPGKADKDAIHNYVQELLAGNGIDLDALDDYDADVIKAAGGLPDILDSNKDGAVDTPEQMAANFKKNYLSAGAGQEAIKQILDLPKNLNPAKIQEAMEAQKSAKGKEGLIASGHTTSYEALELPSFNAEAIRLFGAKDFNGLEALLAGKQAALEALRKTVAKDKEGFKFSSYQSSAQGILDKIDAELKNIEGRKEALAGARRDTKNTGKPYDVSAPDLMVGINPFDGGAEKTAALFPGMATGAANVAKAIVAGDTASLPGQTPIIKDVANVASAYAGAIDSAFGGLASGQEAWNKVISERQATEDAARIQAANIKAAQDAAFNQMFPGAEGIRKAAESANKAGITLADSPDVIKALASQVMSNWGGIEFNLGTTTKVPQFMQHTTPKTQAEFDGIKANMMSFGQAVTKAIDSELARLSEGAKNFAPANSFLGKMQRSSYNSMRSNLLQKRNQQEQVNAKWSSRRYEPYQNMQYIWNRVY